MDLSNYIYDIYEELKLIEKNTSLTEKEKCEQAFKMLEAVEKTNYHLKLKSETINLHLRNLKGDKEKIESNTKTIEQEIDNMKKRSMAISQNLKEVKDIEEKIEKEYKEKEQIAEQQINEIKKNLIADYDYDPKMLEDLKAKNDDLKKRIQIIIDKLKAKEEEYQSNMTDLEKSVGESSKEAQEKFNQYSTMAKELQIVLAKKQYLKIKTETMLQRLKIFRIKVPEFKEVIALKQRQYAKYKTDIKDIVDKGYENYLEKQKIEETIRKMNMFFMDMLQENDALRDEAFKSQVQTEGIKKKCKDLQMLVAKKN